MSVEDQRAQIKKSLQVMTEVFGSCGAEYYVLGSVLIVAYKNKVFRRIGDVDIVLDAKSKDCVFRKLEECGFVFRKHSKAGFTWVEAGKEGHLGLTFLLVGNFDSEFFSWRFMKICELRITHDYLEPTEYEFEGVKFVGIPISSVVAGIKQSLLNPKRRLDKQLLQKELMENKAKTRGNISVYIGNLKIPFLFDVFSFFYNIYGGIRVMFGRKYEVWE
jgi:hypothetical protein